MKRDATRILTRHEANPILKVDDFPGVAQLYNPSPAVLGDETILLVSVNEWARNPEAGTGTGQTHVARSRDGVHFELEEEPFISVQGTGEPWDRYHHIIDNRVTPIGEWFYIVTPVVVRGYGESAVGMLGRTKDFVSYERLSLITAPSNRGASIFPEKIGGKYYKLDRPMTPERPGDIWMSESPDLLHWGGFRPVLAAGYRDWNAVKIGPTPPIRTSAGWLVIMHGTWIPAGGQYYFLGAVLLDLEEPWRVIGRTNSPILMPREDYELHGNCDNTVFACGALADEATDELRVYYGATDSSICLATGSVAELIEACQLGL